MWMMLICCLLPVAVLLFAGGKLSSGGHLWPILFGVMMVAHFAMMFWRRPNKEVRAQEPKGTNGRGGCCS